MAGWFFSAKGINDKERDPVWDECFSSNRSTVESLVRESIQNSLDAAAKKDGPGTRALVRISYSGAKNALPEADYKAYQNDWFEDVVESFVSGAELVKKLIIDKCTEHGLARPEFDPTSGFFKTNIWRFGSGAAKWLVAGASRDPVEGPSRDPVVAQSRPSRGTVKGPSRMLEVIFVTGDTAISQIAMAFGKTRASGSMKRSLLALLEDGLIEYTIPDKPNSRLQKYRLTAKGRKLVASFKQKGGRK